MAYTTKTFEVYWKALRNTADCWWGVTRPYLRDVLKDKSITNVVYHYDEHIIDNSKSTGNQFVSGNPGHSERIIAEQIDPDMWIAEYPRNLVHIKKKSVWVQAFSGLPIKKYMFYEPLLDYDLLLMPGNYHAREFVKRVGLPRGRRDTIQVVGWPRSDELANGELDRVAILRGLGLNPDKKTVMYAPTWGWGHGNLMFFARWFGKELEVFEALSRHMAIKGLNCIVKLHGLSLHGADNEFRSIAKHYNVCWASRETDRYTEDPNPYLWVTDVLISDLSGIISEFLPLDRPIIYIDPDEQLNPWAEADMPKHFRVGHVVVTPEELLVAIDDSLEHPRRYSRERRQLASNLFYALDGKATERATEAVLEVAYRNHIM